MSNERIDAIARDVDTLKTEVAALRRFQSILTSFGVAAWALVMFFADAIRKKLGAG